MLKGYGQVEDLSNVDKFKITSSTIERNLESSSIFTQLYPKISISLEDPIQTFPHLYCIIEQHSNLVQIARSIISTSI